MLGEDRQLKKHSVQVCMRGFGGYTVDHSNRRGLDLVGVRFAPMHKWNIEQFAVSCSHFFWHIIHFIVLPISALCPLPTESESSAPFPILVVVPVVSGSIVAIVALLVGVCCCYYWKRDGDKNKYYTGNSESSCVVCGAQSVSPGLKIKKM